MMMKIWEHVIPSVKNDRICDDIAKWRCHHCVTVQMFQVSFETFHENVVSWLTRGLTMIPEIDFYEMTSILRRISRLPHRRPPTLRVFSQGRQSRVGQAGMDRSGWTGWDGQIEQKSILNVPLFSFSNVCLQEKYSILYESLGNEISWCSFFWIFSVVYSKLYSKIYLELIKPKRTDLKLKDEKVLEWFLRKQTTERHWHDDLSLVRLGQMRSNSVVICWVETF